MAAGDVHAKLVVFVEGENNDYAIYELEIQGWPSLRQIEWNDDRYDKKDSEQYALMREGLRLAIRQTAHEGTKTKAPAHLFDTAGLEWRS